jgi:hypothetical protein
MNAISYECMNERVNNLQNECKETTKLKNNIVSELGNLAERF